MTIARTLAQTLARTLPLTLAKERSGQQLTLDQMSVHKVDLPTESSIGLCAPGDALVRHFFLEVP